MTSDGWPVEADLDLERTYAPAHPAHPMEPTAVRPDAMYVIYTSGTTGRPKGVLGSGESLLRYIEARRISHRIDCESRIFMASGGTFDPSVADIFGALEARCCLCAPQREGLLESLPHLLAASHATHVCGTPALWEALAGRWGYGFGTLPSLRCVALGGEPLPRQIEDAFPQL